MNFSTGCKIIGIISLFFALSCSTPKPCGKEASAYGNLDGVFNTKYNEFSPTFFEGKLYFTMKPIGKNKSEKIYASTIKDTGFTVPVEIKDLPIKSIKNSGTISFFKDGDITELFFAGTSLNKKNSNRDIFHAVKTKGKWSEPSSISEINSPNYESYPFISEDGNLLVFSSDRPGGVGGIDLYYSIKGKDGRWSLPKNMGKTVNTEENEISAFLDKNYNLYFASKGHNSTGGYDIIKAEYMGNYTWGHSYKLPFPINTEFDETGPFIYNDFLFLASNRKDGCGERDLYFFKLCGDVTLEGTVSDPENKIPPNGIVRLYDNNLKKIDSLNVGASGKFHFDLESNKEYYVDYINNCLPLYIPLQKIETHCNDTANVKISLPIKLTYKSTKFEFKKFKVPFFVTGYYKPIVPEYLTDLKTLFELNLIGVKPESKYIENPGNKYDEFSQEVEENLQEVVMKIEELLENTRLNCNLLNNPKIFITITGFTDPRGISDLAQYIGDDLTDKLLPEAIFQGDKMSNEMLSLLRAYFTAKYLQKELLPYFKSHPESVERVLWKIKSGGIEESDDEYIFQRKVDIEIGVN